MKKFKKVLSVFFSILMLISICSAMPAYSQELPSDILMEQRVEKARISVEKRSQKIASGPVKRVSTYAELLAAVEAKATNIYLLDDIYLEDTLQIDYDIFFLADARGKTIYANEGKRHIQITANGVQLQFDNVILDGNYNEKIKAIYFGGINANNITDITIVGLTIQNCKGTAISNSLPDDIESSLSIYNCIIRNNFGNALYTYSTNIVLYNILCENNIDCGEGTITMGPSESSYPYESNLTAEIAIYHLTARNNSASEGGAVAFYNAEVFIDSDTIIENNTVTFGGGGICSYNSNIESYGTIKNNVSEGRGGGILLINSTATIQGGEISYNTASTEVLAGYNFGGGIAIESDTEEPTGNLIVNDCIIEGNIAAFGGAIGSGSWTGATPSYVIINGGTIRNNGNKTLEIITYHYLCECGGGIYADKVKMTGGTIEQNHCLSSGAGIYANDFIMSGGLIQDNGYFLSDSGDAIIQTSQGGGVYSQKSAVITDGLIYSNMAKRGGGVCADGSLQLSAPAYIRYNTAENEGGGVRYVPANSNVDYSRIRNNNAPKGPQYYPL